MQLPSTVPPPSRHFSKSLPREVFRITQCGSSAPGPEISRPLSPSSALGDLEDRAASRMYAKFQAQAYEIKQLKRKIRKCFKSSNGETRKILCQARGIVKQAKVELKDQQDLIENLIMAIGEGKLMPHSFTFDRICTIVKSSIGGDVQFTSREKSEYGYMLKCEKIVDILKGKEVEEEPTEAEVLHQYLLMQTEYLIKHPNPSFHPTNS
eukprot:TRINITY_DN12943_c0_g1_i11.p1 TRINITY_DN12943_c0_g1~~TRINITY_DN12943_c0_g1_i11.p1  ORF type:complete len:209 (+),score=27.39 TRINITY_DN12943_c0_g1_i11:281-907(+)